MFIRPFAFMIMGCHSNQDTKSTFCYVNSDETGTRMSWRKQIGLFVYERKNRKKKLLRI